MRGASAGNFTPVQVYTCNGTSAQQWTVASANTLQALGKCLDVNAAGTSNGTTVDLYDCNGTGAQGLATEGRRRAADPGVRQVPRRYGLVRHARHPAADLVLHRRRQPVLGPAQLAAPTCPLNCREIGSALNSETGTVPG